MWSKFDIFAWWKSAGCSQQHHTGGHHACTLLLWWSERNNWSNWSDKANSIPGSFSRPVIVAKKLSTAKAKNSFSSVVASTILSLFCFFFFFFCSQHPRHNLKLFFYTNIVNLIWDCGKKTSVESEFSLKHKTIPGDLGKLFINLKIPLISHSVFNLL